MNYASSIQSPGLVALPPWRSRALFALLLLGLGVLLARSVYLQGIHNEFLQRKGDARYSRVIDISAHRGMISDRNGEPLAISTPVESVWANPQDVEATPDQVRQLARLLDMNVEELKNRLSESSRDFVYLKRLLPPEQAKRVTKLEIPGISLQQEYRRYYPDGEVAAHLVGFTNVDDKGQEGLELALQDQLAGQDGSQRVIEDRRGHIVEDVASERAPKPGKDVQLSIDNRLQYLAFRAIRQAVEQHHAKAGSIVMLDAKTGEVLALANWPSYNPNSRDKASPAIMRNRAITDQYEPGSTMKPFTVAAALEAGTVTPQTVIDVDGGTMTLNGRTIHDSHHDNKLTVAQVLQVSSNVGAAKMALSLSPRTFWQDLSEDGFGASTDSGFPGETTGKLRNYRNWRPIAQATMSYGNGIAVSLLQLARAYTIFANDGVLLPVSLLKRDKAPAGKRIYTAKVAREVRSMLELVVQPGGTAPKAQIAGYRVAGKTGTAHKLKNGRYVDHYIASFVGMAPASDPRLIVAVKIDDPHGEYYGGEVAGPVFHDVMSSALHLLDVPYDAPLNNVRKPTGEIVKEDT